MNPKYSSFWLIVLAAIVVMFAVAFSGCATTTDACVPAETYAARQGKVLRCFDDVYPDTGEHVTRCWVVKGRQDIAQKYTVFQPHCPVSPNGP